MTENDDTIEDNNPNENDQQDNTKFIFFDLPYEIREIIYEQFKKIRNYYIQLSIRNVCSEWHSISNQIIYYNPFNQLEYIHKFSLTSFKTILFNGNIKRKMIFEPYSKFKYVEYNKYKRPIKIVENFPPYKVIMHEKKENRIHTKTINIISGENTIEISPDKCMNQLNPITYDEDDEDNEHNNNQINLNNGPTPPCNIS